MPQLESRPYTWINKSLATNLIAAGCFLTGLILSEPLRSPVLNMGLFALSGAITNWLAIYMLFEKIPGLYGSGVIPARFEDFKQGIHTLILDQFFSKENLETFFSNTEKTASASGFDLGAILTKTDMGPAFDALVAIIMTSPFGAMLQMAGGKEVLEPMREPFGEKIILALEEISKSLSFQEATRSQLTGSAGGEDLRNKVTRIVQKRLDELTPQMVKEIIQEMIRKHLGWLVVWGGVFGGGIGLIITFLPL